MTRFNATLSYLILISLVASSASAAVDFEKEIKPIFENNCIDCHGPDKQKASLRLDQRVTLLIGGDSGAPAIVPGNSSKSHLMDMIKGTNPDEVMPPKGDPLTKAQIAKIEQWIQEGAEWPGQMNQVAKLTTDHWSFLQVERPDVPASSSKNPVDAFLARKLSEAGIQASAQADAASLIRRASVILTGLPPTPEQVSAFKQAHKADPEKAYNKLVDSLLASPHFGERWAQHWLDVIRWAESNGSEANLYRKNAWMYRDYVVRAFNEDKPYDRFVREQIAGDSMGAGDATGFLVAGPHVPAATVGREPSAIRQARADRMDEIMQTVGASVLGVTMNCARCHNHKFDPVTIKDYYSMTAVFQDVEFGSRFPELSPEHPQKKRGVEIRNEISKHRKELKKIGGWEENWGAFRETHFPPIETKAIRIRFKMGNVSLDELEVFGTTDRRKNLALSRNGGTLSGFPEKGVEGRNPIQRITDGEYGTMTWRGKAEKNGEKPWVRIDFDSPQSINRLRMSSNREYFYDTDYLTQKPWLPRYEFDMDFMQEDGSWKPWTGTWFLNKKLNETHPERKPLLAKIQKLIGTLAEEGPRPSFVARFVPPGKTHVLHRGSPENPRDEVMPAGPLILDGDLGLNSEAPGSKRRAEFAKWITRKDNPLTARVMANRTWHHVFGSGIVTTTSDFGRAGAQPTHPELLEWMAAEFIQPTSYDAKPWSMKGLIRLLVTSDAFKRSSAPADQALEKDSGAALLWRFPPRRVAAEVMRDSILQASGKLDTKIGGRSYRIHNVKKTYAQWEVVNNHGSETWRRMLYQERMRRVDDKMFTAFDFPDCGQVRAKRPVSTTPLQALNLMNSDFIVEQSGFIAERAKQIAGEDKLRKQIQTAFELILLRKANKEELQTASEIAKEHGLNIVCRSLLNSNEFAFLP